LPLITSKVAGGFGTSPLLARAQKRFEITFTLEGTETTFRGMINEPPSGEPPAQRFNIPRRLLLVGLPSIAEVGQLVHSPAGEVFMLGEHGLSESRDIALFKQFRLFVVTHRLAWKRRALVTHPVSGVVVDDDLVDMGLAVGTLEPERATFDRGLAMRASTYNFTTVAPVQVDDVVGDKKVVQVDDVLGLKLCELQ
jgi:hypothetical protein